MKRTGILILMMLATFAVSCRRRPLLEADYTVNVVMNLDRDIVNYTVSKDPSVMRVAFFDHSDGHLVTQAYLPLSGGQVNVLPGRIYDVLAYNFDTQVTLVKEADNFNRIFAATNSISEDFKSKLKSRGTKSAKGDEDEHIVYDPDHLFVGRLNKVDLPARSVDSPEVTLTIDCETVVQSWILEVDKVNGIENVASISAVITGLSEFNRISTGERSDDVATVYFDVKGINADGTLKTGFNTFGQNPNPAERQILSLVITDTAGKGYIFNVDVSAQFPGNKEQIIRVKTCDIVIPKPDKPGSGGGLAPDVDEWKDIVSEIII